MTANPPVAGTRESTIMEKSKTFHTVAEIAVSPRGEGEYLQGRLDDEHSQYRLLRQAYPVGIAVHHRWEGLKAKNNGIEKDETYDEVFKGVGFGEPVGVAPHLVKHGLESATSFSAHGD